ncbi:MAG TPA: hypothetical protein VGE98_15260 [Thermoanaerobaculia bacterium]
MPRLVRCFCGLALAALALGGCGLLLPAASERADRSVETDGEPLQTPTRRTPFRFETGHGAVNVVPRFEFDISAVVASAESYLLDTGAFLSPVDLVMTWGKLPEEPYRSRVSYNQMGRFYFWRTGSVDLDLHYIGTHSANMHLIPATKNLSRALRKVGSGDSVRITGLLVDVSMDSGFTWRTSTTREDDGPGACELIFVESLQRGMRVYR